MFVTMVQERSLRAKAEFELSVRTEQEEWTPNPNPPGSVNESLPTTTDTGRLFQDPTSVTGDVLTKITELGQREHWLIHGEDVCVTSRCIGKGGFGVVLEGSMLGSPVAVKTAHTNGTHLQAPDCNELRIIRLLRHPNVVLWHGACICVSTHSLALVFELIEGVTLSELILDPRCDEPTGDSLIVDICRAIRYLHGQRPTIVHGDLKPNNVMVEAMKDHYRAKVMDFGLSRLVTREARPLGGTIRWMAPEMFMNAEKPNAACDTFSLGRLMYFIITKKVPLAGLSAENIVTLERRGSPVEVDWSVAAAHHLTQIACKCLARQPSLRPQMAEVLNMISAPVVSRQLRPDVGAIQELSLLSPGLQETPKQSRHFMVDEVVRRWNVRLGACCQYHNQLHVLRNDCVKLQSSPCKDHVVSTAQQCATCLALLDESESDCDVCGQCKSDLGDVAGSDVGGVASRGVITAS